MKSSSMNFENSILNVPAETQKKVLNDYMKKAQLELIKQAHPYSITPPKADGGRWQTYVKDTSKKSGRREIKAPSEEALYEALAVYYLIGDKFQEVYESWLAYITYYGKAGSTIQRHEQRYAKYFAHSKIPKMSVRNINLLTLEAECNRIVTEFNLPSKEWQQAKSILLGTFKYAIKKGLIAENPMERIEIGVRFKQSTKKPSETQVYQTEEYHDLMLYLEAMYTETEDDSYLAVMFSLLTGLRVGELVALQFCNICGKKLHVINEEVGDKTKVNGKWEEKRIVVPHTKSNRDRFVTLLPKALDIIKRLNDKHPNHKDTDFLFTREGVRLEERQIAYVLERYAEIKGKVIKSTHKLRKTYASRLSARGVPLEHIRVELGHRYLTSTMDYIYNPLTDDETYNLMAQAF